ncbi:hypothetical protein SLUN_39010 (plasmid) [Streptomyces lunaelactis]|uniref:Uncharacterized protein n=1 Tax=Streptomyces lunaelactis TaxID=1535768 RepID=A0A2R4TFW8_9ACTN|nr:hypothetical protein [Streptomyces lunaelactis]AVZ78021.1 hypothetical protein SLUN_39010 [Streptomyces lunaelactis]NUK84955.1 hypothetical protein [Streptomyces lunaelactis]
MEDWSPDNPFGAITPYWLQVEGKWRLADVLGPFLGEYVTCPFCENQKGFIFETDSTRLGEMADITCAPPCGRKFQILEITGYDLRQRLAFLAGEETDPAWTAKVLAEDPDRASGPLPPAPDELAEPPAEPKAAPAAAGTAEPKAPRLRTERRSRRSRREDPAAPAGPGTRVYRDDAAVNTGRNNGRVTTTTVVASGNNQQINVRSDSRGSRVTADGRPVPEGGKVPRKVAAKAERAVRDAQRLVRESGGRSRSTVQVSGENNSVITSHTDGDQVHITRDTRKEKP